MISIVVQTEAQYSLNFIGLYPVRLKREACTTPSCTLRCDILHDIRGTGRGAASIGEGGRSFLEVAPEGTGQRSTATSFV